MQGKRKLTVFKKWTQTCKAAKKKVKQESCLVKGLPRKDISEHILRTSLQDRRGRTKRIRIGWIRQTWTNGQTECSHIVKPNKKACLVISITICMLKILFYFHFTSEFIKVYCSNQLISADYISHIYWKLRLQQVMASKVFNSIASPMPDNYRKSIGNNCNLTIFLHKDGKVLLVARYRNEILWSQRHTAS